MKSNGRELCPAKNKYSDVIRLKGEFGNINTESRKVWGESISGRIHLNRALSCKCHQFELFPSVPVKPVRQEDLEIQFGGRRLSPITARAGYHERGLGGS